ncbi:hypothetical protein IFM89_024791 [Coptis chinensis]|uniref:Uncharacterized protein n=1 Tax=Coptis chinensis TaxID=261450 RepID=A0A835LSR3_9MAGN|nr:hypothetical protein IFM89_024791 [Coptis chinensis]
MRISYLGINVLSFVLFHGATNEVVLSESPNFLGFTVLAFNITPHACTLETCVEHKLVIDDDPVDRANRVQRGQWLRAAILGSNDGLLSTTSLMLGMAAASEDRWDMILAGVAAAVAGACSMAVGEYVSVATQRDIEEVGQTKNSDPHLFGQESIQPELIPSPATKMNTNSMPVLLTLASPAKKNQGGEATNVKLVNITSMTPKRGSVSATSPGKSPTVREMSPAMELLYMSPKRSPLMRVISEEERAAETDNDYETLPNPMKASCASGFAFLCGSLLPLLSVMIATDINRVLKLVIVTSIGLATFGGLGAHLGGSPMRYSAMRVLVGGWISMGISYGLLLPFKGKGHRGTEDAG